MTSPLIVGYAVHVVALSKSPDTTGVIGDTGVAGVSGATGFATGLAG